MTCNVTAGEWIIGASQEYNKHYWIKCVYFTDAIFKNLFMQLMLSGLSLTEFPLRIKLWMNLPLIVGYTFGKPSRIFHKYKENTSSCWWEDNHKTALGLKISCYKVILYLWNINGPGFNMHNPQVARNCYYYIE